MTAACDGPVVDEIGDIKRGYVKFSPGGVRPGMSGSPLLNEATGAVCGVVKKTRNPEIDLGGFAVPTAAVWKVFPELEGLQRQYHRAHPEWSIAVQSSGAALMRRLAEGPPSVRRKLLVTDFRTLINDRTDGFVGREFVFDAIDSIIREAEPRSGYILLTAEPGLGKTAIIAYLVRMRGYVHHFNVAVMNVRTPKQFIEGITAQLILRYDLAQTEPPHELAEYGNYLAQVLAEAASKRGDSVIVVAVDALDEATDEGLPAGANCLFLPPALPDGVFFVLTSRPKFSFRLVVWALHRIEIGDESEPNLRDARRFIDRFIDRFRESMDKAIAAWGTKREDMAEVADQDEPGQLHVSEARVAGHPRLQAEQGQYRRHLQPTGRAHRVLLGSLEASEGSRP